MYLEKFEKGFKIYQRIENSTFPGEDIIVEQVLKFNENLLLEDPKRIQCHYILGFIYWKKKQNLPMGFEHFENFIKKSRNISTYKFLHDKAKVFFDELSDQMQFTK
jgi:hypothetical protein